MEFCFWFEGEDSKCFVCHEEYLNGEEKHVSLWKHTVVLIFKVVLSLKSLTDLRIIDCNTIYGSNNYNTQIINIFEFFFISEE